MSFGRSYRCNRRIETVRARWTMVIAVLPVLFAAGCASQQAVVADTEQMLVASGFIEKPATTPERQQQLASLPPFLLQRQLVDVNGQPTFAYVYPDPQYCHCALTGDALAYQHYAQLAQQRRIAADNLQAAEMAQNAAFNWNMWGPPAVIVVHHDHDHDHH